MFWAMRAFALRSLECWVTKPGLISPCKELKLWSFSLIPQPSQRRGSKTSTTINAKKLPQGILDSQRGQVDVVDNVPTYPTVIQQALNNMRRFDQCVVLTRVGGFYELYLQHAEEYGPLLNLKVAHKKTLAGRVAMVRLACRRIDPADLTKAGFPIYQLDRFLKILVHDLHKSVAISEEFPNDMPCRARSGGLLFDRRVSRVVTPGTLVDETFMDQYANNFLLALYPQESGSSRHGGGTIHTHYQKSGSSQNLESVGLAWLDLSTGQFFTQSVNFEEVPSSLTRIGAREIVLGAHLKRTTRHKILTALGVTDHVVAWQEEPSREPTISDWFPMLDTAASPGELETLSRGEIFAGTILLNYAKDRLQTQELRIQAPIRQLGNETMGLDRNTLKSLELLETYRDSIPGGRGSLLHTIRRTVTRGGARLLRRRLCYPSTSVAVIEHRLDVVEYLIASPIQREAIVSLLRRTEDSQRIVQKFSLGRGDVEDLLDLRKTIQSTNRITELLKEAVALQSLDRLQTKATSRALIDIISRMSICGPLELASSISETIDEDGVLARRRDQDSATVAMTMLNSDAESGGIASSNIEATSRAESEASSLTDSLMTEDSPWVMKRTSSQRLASLHDELDKLVGEKHSLAVSLRERLGASTLTLRWSPALGHICHIKGARDIRISHDKIAVTRNAGSSKSTRSFYSEDWSALGARIDHMKLQVTNEEQRVLHDLKRGVLGHIVSLRRNAVALDELDVACSSAILAVEQKLTRPLINNSMRHHIIAGRHPTVKMGLEEKGRSFVSNDCSVGDKQRVWLITGPNMAGKSTFLRQNALISVLAQVGSFVPAAHAAIGIVDRMFTRIGAADNLYQDQSTFMVEMLETAGILKLATPRSFVVMDEVGRGTTPDDGIAVAYACLHHLHDVNQCRTLFATHFHALGDMTASWTSLGTYCNDMEEDHLGSFHFLHRLRPGVNRNSQALKVAKLAGMPAAAIDVAASVLRVKGERFSRQGTA